MDKTRTGRDSEGERLTQSVKKVALMPPNNVYINTPTGKRKQAASLLIPVRAVNRVEPPTRRLTLVIIW